MESEWRLNVWRLGAVDQGTEFIARLLEPVGVFQWFGVGKAVGDLRLGAFLRDSGGYIVETSANFFVPRRGFPYGLEVVPD